MRNLLAITLTMTLSGIFAQDEDASHYFIFHPEGTTVKIFETETFHGRKTAKIGNKDYYYTTETSEFGIDTNYYWEDEEYFYKFFPGLGISDNFLPKKVHLDQEWTGKTGKHKYHVARTIDQMEISDGVQPPIVYHHVIHVIMSPVQEGLYVPYHFYYAKGVGLIKLMHETNTYELHIEKGDVHEE